MGKESMKRHGHLWEMITSDENIRWGIVNACRSRSRKTPAKRRNILYTKEHEEETVSRIKTLLLNEFQTSPYYVYPLFDPKLRFIYCLPFYPDRIIHHCLMNVLAPIWDRLMYSGSCACRKGHGQHEAGTRCGIYAKKYRYCAQFDISQFYVNINHRILKGIVSHKIKDNKVLEILGGIIDSIDTRKKNLTMLYCMRKVGNTCKDIQREIQKLEAAAARDKAGEAVGLPIGNYTSQWLGNLYLNEIDTYIKQQLHAKAYARYCDDFLLFSDDKKMLRAYADAIQAFLWENLRLMLSKKEVFPTSQGVDFVGYRYFHTGLVLLRKRTAKKQRQTVKVIRKSIENGTVDVDEARARLGSMHGLLKWARSYHFRQAIRLDEILEEVERLGKV